MSSVPVVYSTKGSYIYYTFQWWQTGQYLSFKDIDFAYLAASPHSMWIESPDTSVKPGQQVQAGDEFWLCSQVVVDRTLDGGGNSDKGYLEWVTGTPQNTFQLFYNPGQSGGGITCGPLLYLASVSPSGLVGSNTNDGYYLGVQDNMGSSINWIIQSA